MSSTAPAIDYETVLAAAESLETLPLTATKLAALLSTGDFSLAQVADVASFDQPLTARLLRRANSSALGARAPARSVLDAVNRLGAGPVFSIAIAGSVAGAMTRALPGYGLVEGELWRRGVAASAIAEVIRAMAFAEVPVDAPTAALLHDFGKAVISQHFGPQVLSMLSRAAASDELDLLAAEEAVFGITHADIGGLVAQRWKLPTEIVDAITHHHDTRGDRSPTSAAVALAHALVPLVVVDPEEAELGEPLVVSDVINSHHAVIETLGIALSDLSTLIERAKHRYAAVADAYDLS